MSTITFSFVFTSTITFSFVFTSYKKPTSHKMAACPFWVGNICQLCLALLASLFSRIWKDFQYRVPGYVLWYIMLCFWSVCKKLLVYNQSLNEYLQYHIKSYTLRYEVANHQAMFLFWMQTHLECGLLWY